MVTVSRCSMHLPYQIGTFQTKKTVSQFFSAFLGSDMKNERACVVLPWKYCNRAPFFFFFFFPVVTICGANHSLLLCFFTAPGSQRSPVNQCGCHSDVSFLGFFIVDEVSLSTQLVLFSCHSSSSVYSEQIGNINLFPACAPQNYSQMYET